MTHDSTDIDKFDSANSLTEGWSRHSADGGSHGPRHSDLQFRVLWDKSMDGMRVTDENGRILMVNPAFCRMVGMSSEALIGSPFSVVYGEGEREHVLAAGVARFERRSIQPHLQRTLTLWNGRSISFEASNSFVELAGRPALLSIFRDITERAEAQEAIRHAAEYSENIIANAPILIAHLDRLGRVTRLNRTAERVVGYRIDELENRNWLRLLMPRRRFPAVWSAFRHQRAGTKRTDFEAPLITRQGEKRIIQWNYSEVREHGEVVGLIAFGSDVTEARRADAVLQRYQLLLKHSSDIMLLVGPTGRIVESNGAAENAYGYARDEMLSMNISDLRAAPDAPLEEDLGEGLTQRMHRRRCGAAFPVEVNCTDATITGERMQLMVIRDITERRAMEAELQRQAFHDPLTGLANRALFLDRLTHALAGTARRMDNAAVLFLDLDRFKLINDGLGHEAGDSLLVAVARRITRCLRGEDTAARFGGDEFTILLESLNDESEATRVADRILQRLAAPFRVADREVYVTASIGVAFSRGTLCTPEDLIKSADLAMYQVKETGRSNYAVFEREMSTRAVDRLDMEADLRSAIVRHEFQLHLQPIIQMRPGRVVGFEALVRWQHPRLGMVPPADFIPLQEQIGLSDELTAWVLAEAHRHHLSVASEQRNLRTSINLCGHHLLDEEFPAKVRAQLESLGATTDWLAMEVTESAMVSNPGRSRAILLELEAMGIRLVLDDFGVGYSSLAYLKELPVHDLKIDRSVIATLQADGDSTVAKAAIDLAHTLGRRVIAEGVESETVWKTLAMLGCDAAQGFHVGAPMPADDLDRWLAESPFAAR